MGLYLHTSEGKNPPSTHHVSDTWGGNMFFDDLIQRFIPGNRGDPKWLDYIPRRNPPPVVLDEIRRAPTRYEQNYLRLPPVVKTTPSVLGNDQSYISDVAKAYGIPPSWIMAVAANETGWGKYAPNNNYFGIKGTGPAGSIISKTWEVLNGKQVDTVDSFRAYDNAKQSIDDFMKLISTDRYKAALAAKSAYDFADTLQKSGYATDPNWARKIASLASTIESR